MTKARRRRGLTWIEVAVVLAVLVLLASFLLPSVRHSSEAARRASCAVKLKNLATAVHIYHDGNGEKFPPSAFYKDGQNLGDKDIALKTVVPGQGGTAATRAPYSFLVRLLPYLEAGYLIYDPIDFKHHEAFDKENKTLASKVVPVLTCPSFRDVADSQASDYNAFSVGGWRPALTQFKALGATTLACLQDSASVTSEQLNGGILHPYAAYKLEDLPAPSQTAMLVETKEPLYAAWWDGTTASIPGFHPGTGNNADDRTPTPPTGVPALNLSEYGDQPSFITSKQFGGTGDMQWGPSSDHPGLVNHAFCGTEVRSLSQEIDPTVYRAMISRRADDNKDIGDFFK